MSTVTFRHFWYAHHRHGLLSNSQLRGVENHAETHNLPDTTMPADVLKETIERNNQRKSKIREQCSLLNETISSQYYRRKNEIRIFGKSFIKGMTDKHYSFVYCRVNKAASWYTVITLSQLLGYSKEELMHFAAEFRHLPYEKIKTLFDKAYTFMFVREPYGRLFSTYSNKFYFPKGNWAPVGTAIVQRYRKNPTEDSLRFGHDVTFAEMIRFTVEEYEAGSKMDEHLGPMHVYCKPCNYDYDFIGKLETSVPDWQYLIQQLKARGVISNVPDHPGEKKSIYSDFSEMSHFKITLENVRGSNIDIYSLYKRAWRYFQINSKISKHIEMPFFRTKEKEITFVSFLQEIERAASLSYANTTQLKQQKQEAMLQAYSTVPLELMERLRRVVLMDCLLYDYDDRPEWMLNRKNKTHSVETFDYFSDLN